MKNRKNFLRLVKAKTNDKFAEQLRNSVKNRAKTNIMHKVHFNFLNMENNNSSKTKCDVDVSSIKECFVTEKLQKSINRNIFLCNLVYGTNIMQKEGFYTYGEAEEIYNGIEHIMSVNS